MRIPRTQVFDYQRITAVFFLFFFFTHPLSLFAAANVTKLTLEELLDTEVYSASKEARPLSETPAAVYVITQDDIKRSPHKTIPDLLRMVPGLQVASQRANSWAISSRGFNDALANKLLVMIDGRSVYTPLYAGVYWDVQDLALADIDRIEVIRGPGGSIWGANAVNGVINIITKSSFDTKKILVGGGGGSERQDTTVRVGHSIGENAAARVYGKFFNYDSSHNGNDAWYQGRGGFRTDWNMDAENSFTFQGDYYNGEEDIRTANASFEEAPFLRTIREDQAMAGGNLLGRWNHRFSETSDGMLRMYFDQTKRDQTLFDEDRYAYDVEWNQRFQIGDRHEVVYGFGYRINSDVVENSFSTQFNPSRKTTHLLQFFAQDTYALIREKLWLTTGLRVERNTFSGFEFQPTVRLLYQPAQKHTLWTAFSRAVKTPSRFERDLLLQGWLAPGTVLGRLYADPTSESEELLAYEAGYRVQMHKRLFADLALFYNHYNHLRTSRIEASFSENGQTIVPYYLDDQGRAHTYGAELSLNIEARSWWHIKPAYTYLKMLVETPTDPVLLTSNAGGKNPQHSFYIRNQFNLPHNIEFDIDTRFVSALEALNLPSYWEMDLRLGWRPVPQLLLNIIGTNLVHPYHQEFSSNPQPQRAVYGEAIFEF